MPKGKEIVYRQLLHLALEEKRRASSQLELAKLLGVSLSTVNGALRPLFEMGALARKPRGLSITDWEKLLLYFATVRRIAKDVMYSTRAPGEVREIEASLPPGVIFTAFSGYARRFAETPASYSEVYAYASEEEAEETRKRFPPQKGPPNLLLLKKDAALERLAKERSVPIGQLFADLWSLPQWYAREYADALMERLKKQQYG